ENAAVEQRSAYRANGLSIRNRDGVALGCGADEAVLATGLLVDGVLAARACGDGQAGENHSSQRGKKPIAAAAALLGRRPHGASSVRYEPEWHCPGPGDQPIHASRSGDGSGWRGARGLGVIDAHHDIARKGQRGYRSKRTLASARIMGEGPSLCITAGRDKGGVGGGTDNHGRIAPGEPRAP